MQYHECMRCDSEIDDNCAIVNDPFEFVESCIGTPYTYAARGCFTMKKSKQQSNNERLFLRFLFYSQIDLHFQKVDSLFGAVSTNSPIWNVSHVKQIICVRFAGETYAT